MTSVYIVDRETRACHMILNVTPDRLGPGLSISSDDRAFYITRETREADLWLLELN